MSKSLRNKESIPRLCKFIVNLQQEQEEENSTQSCESEWGWI